MFKYDYFTTSKLKNLAKKPVVIIILSSILVSLSNWPVPFSLEHEWLVKDSVGYYFAQAFSSSLIMFVLPALVIKLIFDKPLSSFGLCLPNKLSEAIKLSTAAILTSLPVMFFLSSQTTFQEYYTFKQSFGLFLLISIGPGGLYYFSEEFIFRGILFFGLWDRLKLHSFWIAGLIFALFHIGKPSGEVLVAFFLGLMFSYLSFKTKSFLPAVVVHMTLAFVLNTIINFSPIF